MNFSIKQTIKTVLNALKKIKKHLRRRLVCLSMLFMHIKNMWVKVVYLRFVLFRLFVHVESFRKKNNKTAFIPSNLILLNSFHYHNTFESSQYFSVITIFFNYHSFLNYNTTEFISLSQYFLMITIFFNYQNVFQSSQYFSIITIFFNDHNIF